MEPVVQEVADNLLDNKAKRGNPSSRASSFLFEILRRASLLFSFSFALAGPASPLALVLLRLLASNYHAASSS
jgi:hypothetical protein